MRARLLLMGFAGLALASACAPVTSPASPAGQAQAAGQGGTSTGTLSQLRAFAPTATLSPPNATRAPSDAAGPPTTPLPSIGVTPVPPSPPAMPTLPLPPTRELDPSSAAAATHVAATAVARIANASGTATALPAQEIIIRDLAFSPTTMTVKPGTRVIWRNADRVQHQVQGGNFDSGRLDSGYAWAALMEKPGRFAFLCSFHPNMLAEIIVSEDESRPQQTGS